MARFYLSRVGNSRKINSLVAVPQCGAKLVKPGQLSIAQFDVQPRGAVEERAHVLGPGQVRELEQLHPYNLARPRVCGGPQLEVLPYRKSTQNAWARLPHDTSVTSRPVSASWP